MDYINVYKEWCENSYFNEETKNELLSIKDNKKEIEERFYKELEFGTGGLRGIIGAGTNRINIYTVRKATQGLANFIISENGQKKGVVIAYDSRYMSPEFAQEAALCLNANDIKTYMFDSLRPTPELSFAVRYLGCIAGIVITASHNPPEYNGYKVYWEDGAQITYPKDKEIIEQVNLIAKYDQVKTMDKIESESKGLYHSIGLGIDDLYINALKKEIISPEIIKAVADEIKIVYTPLHGAGNIPVRRILKELGFKNVYVVPEQELPDINFSTVDYPNPEDSKAFALALKLAKEVDADIVLATDPDADRLGIYVKDEETNEYVSFTGNMSGVLIAEYIISQKEAKGILPTNGALIKTIVTTKMIDALAKDYNLEMIEVLTGFKYIGEQINFFEQNHTFEYVFGLEESYGCLVGTHARDKDAVGAAMALCEVASYCKYNKITLWNQMMRLYNKYGFYREGLESITIKGANGVEQIKKMMDKLRANPPQTLGGYKVTAVRDYNSGKVKDIILDIESDTGLPKSNVLYYELDNDSWCCVRPSGTEPKIKFYMGVKGNSIKDAEKRLKKLTSILLSFVQS